VSITAPQNAVCSGAGTTVTLTADPDPSTAVGNYSYSWNEQGNATVLGTNSTLDVSHAATTTYEVTVTDSGLPSGQDSASSTFTVIVNPTPVADDPADVTECDSYVLPALAVGDYFDAPNGAGTMLNAGDVITVTSTVYVFAQSGTNPNCTDENSFTITIVPTPIADDPADVTECDSYVLPALAVGDYFDAPNGAGNMLNVGDVITVTSTLYVFAQSGTNPNCTDENEFTITIINSPAIDPINDIDICSEFELPDILGTDLSGNEAYYTLQDGGGRSFTAGEIIRFSDFVTYPVTIFIYDSSGGTADCKDETSFQLNISEGPDAINLGDVIYCDDNNDGSEEIDLFSLSDDIANLSTAVTVTYYSDLVDARSGSDSLPRNLVLSIGQTSLFARVVDPNTGCFSTTPVELILFDSPNPELQDEYLICRQADGTLIDPPILMTGLPANSLTYEWFFDDGSGDVLISNANGPNLEATAPGLYTVIATDSNGCSGVAVASVVLGGIPSDFGATETGNHRLNKHSIETFVVFGGLDTTFEVRLNDESWLPMVNSENRFTYRFTNVLTGTGIQTLSFRSTDGCWEASTIVRTIGVPQFFTPNNDNFNDRWNIEGIILTDPNATVEIFDRFGKLVKTISVSGTGWDGTLNNQFINESDYWYKLTYIDKDAEGNLTGEKEIRGHFSLKR
jgi:gliding motility-associated-like protein